MTEVSKGQLWIRRDRLPNGVRRLLLIEASDPDLYTTGVMYLQHLTDGQWKDDHTAGSRRGLRIRTDRLHSTFDLLRM
jgi:hypothetical protein